MMMRPRRRIRRLKVGIWRWVKSRLNPTIFWLALVGIVLACSIVLPAVGWGWLRSGASGSGTESNSTTIRNIGFIVAGILALVIALWRALVAEREAASSQRQAEIAERQADIAQRQAETTQRQAETAQSQAEATQRQAETAQSQAEAAQQGLLNERYQRGSELLGSEVLTVRLNGIYSLQRLAEERPEQYHIQVMQLFCAYVRNPTGEADGPVVDQDEGGGPIRGLREDVQTVMYAIGRRSEVGIALENDAENFQLDLPSVKLQHSQLQNVNLLGAILDAADFSYASLNDANLSRARLSEANLSGARLLGANLSRARFSEANLSGARLLGADLSRASLNDANLSRASLYEANLSGARLLGADLSRASLNDANLSRARLFRANLSGARLAGADLTGADLENSILTGSSFNRHWRRGDRQSPATGLTQAQLDEARSDPDNPPDLEGVLDAETGEQLVWQGLPVDDDPAPDG